MLREMKRCIKQVFVVACFVAHSRRRRGGGRGVEESAALGRLGSPLRHELLLAIRCQPGVALPHVGLLTLEGCFFKRLPRSARSCARE